MPSCSLEMTMSAVGIQKPALASMGFFLPVAESSTAADLFCAAAGAAKQNSAAAATAQRWRRGTDVFMSLHISAFREKTVDRCRARLQFVTSPCVSSTCRALRGDSFVDTFVTNGVESA